MNKITKNLQSDLKKLDPMWQCVAVCGVESVQDLSSITANVDVTVRALFVKVPLKLLKPQ